MVRRSQGLAAAPGRCLAIGALGLWLVAAAIAQQTAGVTPAVTEPADVSAALARTRSDPASATSWRALGLAYYDAGALPEAFEAYRVAVELDPGDVPTLVNAGVALNEIGRPGEALEWFQRARARAPRDPLVLCNQALAHAAMGDTGAAVRLCVEALEIDPRSQLAHFQLGVAFAEAGILREAMREWEAVIAIDGHSAAGQQARQNLARLRILLDAEGTP